MRNLHWDAVNHCQADSLLSVALRSILLESNASHMLERWGYGNSDIMELHGDRKGEKREWKGKKLRGRTAWTIPSHQITLILHCGFHEVVCHVRLKSRLSSFALLNVRFLPLLIEAFPQKCRICLDGIHHPFSLLSLPHVFSVLPFSSFPHVLLVSCKHERMLLSHNVLASGCCKCCYSFVHLCRICIVSILSYPFIKSWVWCAGFCKHPRPRKLFSLHTFWTLFPGYLSLFHPS